MNVLDFLLITIPVKLRKKIVLNASKKDNQALGRVLLYYKTDSYFSKRLAKKSMHTNDAEILYMIETLDQMGFEVDLLDRQVKKNDIIKLKKFDYQLFISNCAGNSSPHHEFIIENLRPQKVIAYAMGPDPVISTKLVVQRHLEFEKRCGFKPVVRRTVDVPSDIATKRFESSDAIIVNGQCFSANTFKKYNKPIFYVPSTIAKFSVRKEELITKRPNTYLFFGGNGLICKGLDIVLEAFDGVEGVELHICGPLGELDFWNFYSPLLLRNPFIKFHGFVSVGSESFYRILSETSFQIFPSSSEGSATSVLTAMRMGVIPIVTYEAGIEVGSFGEIIESSKVSPAGIREIINRLKELPETERLDRIKKTFLNSLGFSEATFKSSLVSAISQIVQDIDFTTAAK